MDNKDFITRNIECATTHSTLPLSHHPSNEWIIKEHEKEFGIWDSILHIVCDKPINFKFSKGLYNWATIGYKQFIYKIQHSSTFKKKKKKTSGLR